MERQARPENLSQVEAYESELGGSGNAEDFFDYFTSNGWMVGGRAPMKDWRAAFRRWNRNAGKFAPRLRDSWHTGDIAKRTKIDWNRER